MVNLGKWQFWSRYFRNNEGTWGSCNRTLRELCTRRLTSSEKFLQSEKLATGGGALASGGGSDDSYSGTMASKNQRIVTRLIWWICPESVRCVRCCKKIRRGTSSSALHATSTLVSSSNSHASRRSATLRSYPSMWRVNICRGAAMLS